MISLKCSCQSLCDTDVNESSNDIQSCGLEARTQRFEFDISVTRTWAYLDPMSRHQGVGQMCIQTLLEKLMDVLSGTCRWPDEKSVATFPLFGATGFAQIFPLPCLFITPTYRELFLLTSFSSFSCCTRSKDMKTCYTPPGMSWHLTSVGVKWRWLPSPPRHVSFFLSLLLPDRYLARLVDRMPQPRQHR